MKPKYEQKGYRHRYIDIDSFIEWIKTDDIYKDIGENVETSFDISNYESERPLPKAKNKKVIDLMKDELNGKITTELVGLRAKTYSYIKDDGSETKKVRGTKRCVIKRKLKFEDYKNFLEATQLENKVNHLEKNKIWRDSVNEDYKEFIKNNKLILTTPQIFGSERQNVF